MSDQPNLPGPTSRRLLRPLPTAGASRRIRKQPANTTEQNNQPPEKNAESKGGEEAGSVTPKAAGKDLACLIFLEDTDSSFSIRLATV
jgi:hypothetical protein